MLTIGLTGGIASGKSTVANFFAELGIEIIDTDQIARDVVAKETVALKTIAAHFGAEILTADQELNRKKLREIIFKNPQERLWLENLLHPLIRQASKQHIQQAKSPYCILVIPLLVENLPHELVDRILVVDIEETLQIARSQQRDNVSEAQIKAILTAQANRQQRLAVADDIIHNDGDLTHLQQQVWQCHQRYLELAQS